MFKLKNAEQPKFDGVMVLYDVTKYFFSFNEYFYLFNSLVLFFVLETDICSMIMNRNNTKTRLF